MAIYVLIAAMSGGSGGAISQGENSWTYVQGALLIVALGGPLLTAWGLLNFKLWRADPDIPLRWKDIYSTEEKGILAQGLGLWSPLVRRRRAVVTWALISGVGVIAIGLATGRWG